jgi:methylglutamate dehydrogenase subunit D
MADRRGPLTHHSGPGDRPGVTLSEVLPGSIVQVQAWPDTLDTVRRVISELLGIDAPAVGRSAGTEDILLAATAPGRFLITSDATDLAERFEAALTAQDGAVTDLAHGRTILRLEGERAAAIMTKCVAIDLDPTVFPPGRVAQTAIHHIDVLLYRRSETSFDLWSLRSFTEALAEWLEIRAA